MLPKLSAVFAVTLSGSASFSSFAVASTVSDAAQLGIPVNASADQATRKLFLYISLIPIYLSPRASIIGFKADGADFPGKSFRSIWRHSEAPTHAHLAEPVLVARLNLKDVPCP